MYVQNVPVCTGTTRTHVSTCARGEAFDTDTGLVDVGTIPRGNSQAVKRDRVTWKPVAVAEGREGGPATLDLTKWDFNKADCQKIDRMFETVVADGISDRF